MSDETPTNEPTPAPETPAPPAAETPAAAAADTQPDIPATAAPTEPEIPVAPAPAPTAVAAAPVAAPVPPAAEPVTATSTSHVAVPKWVLATVAGVVGAAVMFGIGYAVGDGSNGNDNNAAISAPFGNQGNGNQQMPVFPGNGNQGNGNQQMPSFPGNGNQGNGNQQVPSFPGNGNQGNGNQGGTQSPSQPTSGAFLGIATQQTASGLEVMQVVSGSAADDAGLQVGDIIVQFDGNRVTTPAQLANAVSNLEPGDEVEIGYQRDGDTRTVTVELGSRSTTNSN